MEHNGGALPGDTVLPVVVGGVHGGAAEHASNSAGGIGAVIGNATPGGRGADVSGVVVSQEGLDAHKLLKSHGMAGKQESREGWKERRAAGWKGRGPASWCGIVGGAVNDTVASENVVASKNTQMRSS